MIRNIWSATSGSWRKVAEISIGHLSQIYNWAPHFPQKYKYKNIANQLKIYNFWIMLWGNRIMWSNHVMMIWVLLRLCLTLPWKQWKESRHTMGQANQPTHPRIRIMLAVVSICNRVSRRLIISNYLTLSLPWKPTIIIIAKLNLPSQSLKWIQVNQP